MNKAFKTENIHYAILADTDSVYFTLDKLVQSKCCGMSDQEIVNYLESFTVKIIQPLINSALDKLMAKLGIDNPAMVFKLECIGPSIVPVAKKRYAFDILYSEGVRYETPKMKVIGMEIVRSSTPSVIKDKLKVAVKTILSKEEKDLQKYVKEVKDTFMNFPYTDIAFPRGCNGLLTYTDRNGIYKDGCPIHVRGALLYNYYVKKLNLDSKYPLIGEGEKIKFIALKMPNPIHENVIGFLNKIPEELGLDKYIDYDTQFQKAFMKPIEGVLEAVKWNAEERINLEDFY